MRSEEDKKRQRREAQARYEKNKKEHGFKRGWAKKDENNSKKDLTDYIRPDTLSP